jgi:hypothetical protein
VPWSQYDRGLTVTMSERASWSVTVSKWGDELMIIAPTF